MTQPTREMSDYSKGKVYRILQDNEKTVYIGSTVQPLSARMAQHRKGIKHCPNMQLYILMAEVGVDHFSIELVVDVPCDRLEQLQAEEGRQIRLHNTVANGANKATPGRTRMEWARDFREANPQLVASRKAKYYQENRAATLQHVKEYREQNKVAVAARDKKKYDDNKEAISVRAKAYYQRKKAERAAAAAEPAAVIA